MGTQYIFIYISAQQLRKYIDNLSYKDKQTLSGAEYNIEQVEKTISAKQLTGITII